MSGPAITSAFAKKQDMYEQARPVRDILLDSAEPNYADHDEKLWMLAIDLLVSEGELDAATAAIGPLLARFPKSRTLGNLEMVLSRMPPPVDDARFAGFRDDLNAEVQVVPRAGARTVLLGFGGNRGKMGVPLNIIHRWFGQEGVHVIYLRDMVTKLFMRGIASLGPDYPATMAALRGIFDELGADRIVCQGNSGGGFAALRFGLDLGAESILTFGAQSHPFLDPDKKTIRLIERFGVKEAVDLRPLFDSAERPPKVRFVFSADHERDALQAKNMDGAKGVTLEPVFTEGDHGVMLPLIKNGRYNELLRELTTGEPAPPAR